MKKIFISLGLSLATSVAFAQTATTFPLLSVPAVSVSNTVALVNTATYFGQSSTQTTNTTGLQYTNKAGILITVASNSTTALVVNTNGTGVYTNDPTSLALDIPLHADRNGNVCTNYILGAALTANATSTGAVVCVFGPILKFKPTAPSYSAVVQPLPTLIDTANLITVAFPILRAGSTNACVSVNFAGLAGYQGLRLLSATVTNATGQVWVQGINMSTFVP